MRYAYTYFFTCIVLPFFWDTPQEHYFPEPELPELGPPSHEYPYRCNCLSAEPDTECAIWAWENCEVHPTEDDYWQEPETETT